MTGIKRGQTGKKDKKERKNHIPAIRQLFRSSGLKIRHPRPHDRRRRRHCYYRKLDHRGKVDGFRR